jgi:hypothetical protein
LNDDKIMTGKPHPLSRFKAPWVYETLILRPSGRRPGGGKDRLSQVEMSYFRRKKKTARKSQQETHHLFRVGLMIGPEGECKEAREKLIVMPSYLASTRTLRTTLRLSPCFFLSVGDFFSFSFASSLRPDYAVFCLGIYKRRVTYASVFQPKAYSYICLFTSRLPLY